MWGRCVRAPLTFNWHLGEAIPFNARAYTTSTPRTLHTEASCHRRELPVDDQYSSYRAPPTTPAHADIWELRYGNSVPQLIVSNTEVVYGHERDAYVPHQRSPAPPRSIEDQYPAAATAAVALAQLHSHRPDSDWDSEAVRTIASGIIYVHS